MYIDNEELDSDAIFNDLVGEQSGLIPIDLIMITPDIIIENLASEFSVNGGIDWLQATTQEPNENDIILLFTERINQLQISRVKS